ncbi:HAD family hydrolase [Mesoterricola sediminis]|uniref:Hydrolase n=1 Tax=Mesoterricola sediminis TaxID=2927980 RepID=A0AA48GSN3_9BACT|nr:HAD family hydrolase [Mesoterricola sediminis]BDU75449.1 hydrolase [Mesoterricola sediminis]
MGSLLAVGFDLDYTLWDHGRFAETFFAAVAGEVGGRLGLAPARVEAELRRAWRDLTPGHPRLFDTALARLGSADPALAADLVARYRRHRPPIRPYPGALPLLEALRRKGLRLFLVTDGGAAVQRYKVEALGLASAFDARVFTGDFPALLRKPSPFPFLVACRGLGVPPRRCAFVGDNPETDFEAPRCLGMLAIGVTTGPYAELPPAAGLGPHRRVRDLRDLEDLA